MFSLLNLVFTLKEKIDKIFLLFKFVCFQLNYGLYCRKNNLINNLIFSFLQISPLSYTKMVETVVHHAVCVMNPDGEGSTVKGIVKFV